MIACKMIEQLSNSIKGWIKVMIHDNMMMYKKQLIFLAGKRQWTISLRSSLTGPSIWYFLCPTFSSCWAKLGFRLDSHFQTIQPLPLLIILTCLKGFSRFSLRFKGNLCDQKPAQSISPRGHFSSFFFPPLSFQCFAETFSSVLSKFWHFKQTAFAW